MYCNITPIKPQPNLRNFVNFVAVASEKHLDMCQPSLTHFLVSHVFVNLTVEVFMCSMWLSLCFAFPVFPSLPSLSPPVPHSHGDMLEVIITIASGFISIYSHNNTEKGKTDNTGVMYYPVRESSFIMTSNRASSPCHHPFLSLSLIDTHSLSSFLSPPLSTLLCPPCIITESSVLPSL